MGVAFIISGVLLLILIINWVRIDRSEGIDIQPSLKSILTFWKEEAGIKKLVAILEFYCLYVITIGIIFIAIGFDSNSLLEVIASLVLFSAPALLYRAIRYIQKKQ